MLVDVESITLFVTTRPLATTVIAVTITAVVIKKLESLFASKSSNPIPVPPGKWPIIGHLPLFLKSRKPITEALLPVLVELSRKFEKEGLFELTLGPKSVVFFCSPETIEPLLVSTVNIYKGPEYGLLKRWLGNSILIANGEQ